MISELRARGFRNLAPLSFAPAASLNLLSGDNGAGKTSLLEAVYAVATTRSFRADLAACCGHGESGFELAATLAGELRTTLGLTWAPAGRERTRDGKPSALAEHLGTLPVAAWTAAHGALIQGPPSHRRRFIDRGLVVRRAEALATLGRFRRTLEHKRRLLERGGGGDHGVWNELFANAAAAVIARRAAYVEELAARLADVLARLDPSLPRVTLRYRPSPAAGIEGEAALLAHLARVAPEELRRRCPLVGPHRDELEVLWSEHPAAVVASAGERKLLGLAMTLAQGELAAAGTAPLYLLDDLDAELDRRRLEAAWRVLAAAPPGAQVLATTSHPEAWASLGEAARWRVAAGFVTAA